MSSKLFTPHSIGRMELTNRITVAPMCQYSAIDGSMTDWHLMHLGHLALSGAAMLPIEATGVTPEGRITHGCTGLYSDANEAAMKRVVDFVRSISPIRVGIQLAHAGRKASAQRPWEGRGALKAEEGAWETVAPSPIPLAPGWPAPTALDRAGMNAVRDAHVAAARRAVRLGLDFIELHSTHGYLLSEFLSPLANRRSDAYGGSLENRMRFPLEVFSALRETWPREKPMGAKIGGTDFAEGGWTVEEAVAYARELKARGCDYVTVSGGGVVLDAKVPVGARLPGALRRARPARSGDYDGQRRVDHRSAPGRRDRRERQSRLRVARPRGCCSIRAGRGTPRSRSAPTSNTRRSTSAAIRKSGLPPPNGRKRKRRSQGRPTGAEGKGGYGGKFVRSRCRACRR